MTLRHQSMFVLLALAGIVCGAGVKGDPLPEKEPPREETLEMRHSHVHRLAGDERKGLAEGVVVVQEAGRSKEMMASVYLATLPDAKKGPLVSKGGRLCIFAVGPQLDNIWQVAARSLVRRGQDLELTIVLADPQKGIREKTYPVRHLVYVPLELPRGAYRLKTIWRFLEAIPDGKPTDAKPLTYTCEFNNGVREAEQ